LSSNPSTIENEKLKGLPSLDAKAINFTESLKQLIWEHKKRSVHGKMIWYVAIL
jgi:hypothetical protein